MGAAERRLVFVLPSFAGGGAERVMLTLAANLDREKFSPTLIVLDRAGPLETMVPEGMRVHCLHKRRLRAALPALRSSLRRIDPDIVVSSIGYLNLGVLLLRPFLPRRIRYVVREANTPSLSLSTMPAPTLFRFAYRRLYPRADRVLSPSRIIAEELAGMCHVPASRIVRLYNPVDTKRVRRAANPPLRTGGKGLRFVASGRLTEQKGFDSLLDMFESLPRTARLTILGDGPDRADLTLRARRLGIGDRVSFPGFVEKPWRHYAGADAFLMPSRWEGLPNAALESLACGTPVIATPEAGGIGEIAELARPGAVTLASAGEQFVAAMKAVRSAGPKSHRASLLPGPFGLDTVVNRFQDTLLAL